MNTKYSADYVITQGPQPTSFCFWFQDTAICCVGRRAIDLMVAGASARKASVYDETRDEFLCGTLAQLAPVKGA